MRSLFYHVGRSRSTRGALLAAALAGLCAAAAPARAQRPPSGAAPALARLDSLLAVGAADQAVPLARRAVEQWSGDPLFGWQVQGRAGAVLVAAGRAAEALPLLEEALRRRPQDSGLHHQLGLALAALGRRGRALAEFEQASALDPQAPAPHFEAGRQRAALGDWRRAQAELEIGRRLCGDCPEADRLLGSLLLAAGRPAEALAPLQRLWVAQPDSQVRHHLLGALAGARQDSALLALVEATPAGQRTRDDWRMAVQAEGRLGGACWAAAALALADSAGPDRFPRDDAVFWAQGALNLLAAGQAAPALQAVDRALAIEPGRAVFHHNRAAILTALDRPAEARLSLDAARALEGTPPPAARR